MEKKRALSLDLARGSMLLLIILAHVPLMMYLSEPGVITKLQPENIFEEILNALMVIFVDNRARPLFAVLFGYGLVMIYRKQVERQSEQTAKRIIKRRCWYLILFGAALMGIFGGQDILMSYGIAGLILLPLINKPYKTLMTWIVMTTVIYTGIVFLVWGTILFGIQSYGLPVEWTGRETYFNTILERLISVPLNPLITYLMFPVLPSVLMGFWLGRRDIFIQPEQNWSFLKKLLIITAVISIVGAVPLLFVNEVWFPEYFTAGLIYGVHMITGLAAGLFYAAFFAIIGRKIKHPGSFIQAMAAMGKRSLTFFCIHEILIVLFLSPIGFNLGAHLSITTGVIFGFLLWGVNLFAAHIIETRNIPGPLEQLMKKLVYKTKD
jgi:uncharacterized protein